MLFLGEIFRSINILSMEYFPQCGVGSVLENILKTGQNVPFIKKGCGL